jgi:ribonuclease P protein component
MNAESHLGADTTRMGSMKEPKSAVWLTQRAEFLAAAKGRRHHAALFTIQAMARRNAAGGPRFGLTVTTKTGNSVERSRIKRRLREAIRLEARLVAFPGTDYVLIGRRALLDAPFETITAELIDGISRLKPRHSPSLKSTPSSP